MSAFTAFSDEIKLLATKRINIIVRKNADKNERLVHRDLWIRNTS